MEHGISDVQMERACDDLGLVFDDTLTDEKVFEAYETVGNKTDLHRAAKILILKRMASAQLVEGDGKHFSFKTPFNSCSECRGVGEIFMLEFDEMSVPCESCKGKGVKAVPCKECSGSGKTENGEAKCRLCRGSGKYWFRKNKYREEDRPCPQCYDHNEKKALGHRKVQIATGRIKGSYPCTCKDGKLKVHTHKTKKPTHVVEHEHKPAAASNNMMADAIAKAQAEKEVAV